MKFCNHQTKNECHIEFYDFEEETGKKSRAKDQIKFNLLDVIKLYLLLLYTLLLRIPKKKEREEKTGDLNHQHFYF